MDENKPIIASEGIFLAFKPWRWRWISNESAAILLTTWIISYLFIVVIFSCVYVAVSEWSINSNATYWHRWIIALNESLVNQLNVGNFDSPNSDKLPSLERWAAHLQTFTGLVLNAFFVAILVSSLQRRDKPIVMPKVLSWPNRGNFLHIRIANWTKIGLSGCRFTVRLCIPKISHRKKDAMHYDEGSCLLELPYRDLDYFPATDVRALYVPILDEDNGDPIGYVDTAMPLTRGILLARRQSEGEAERRGEAYIEVVVSGRYSDTDQPFVYRNVFPLSEISPRTYVQWDTTKSAKLPESPKNAEYIISRLDY